VAVAISVNNRIVSIVDDDPDIAILFYDALKSIAGITIFTFTDPIRALEHFHVNEHAYVVIISDFKMPGLNGMEFLKKKKDSNSFVRTILMTAFEIDRKIFRKYTKMKIINGFLQKPIGLHDLIKEVDPVAFLRTTKKISFLMSFQNNYLLFLQNIPSYCFLFKL
jgi:DNA-binding NtrC family response regulator